MCPKGDDQTVKVVVDLDDSDVTRTLEPNEFRVVFNEDNVVRFGDGAGAEAPANAGNSYTAALPVSAAGGTGIDSATVFLDDVFVTGVRLPLVRTPDFNKDASVNLSDVAFYSSNHPSPPKPYVGSCDFNNDGRVDLADWAKYGQHHGHSYSSPQAPQGSGNADATFSVRLEVNQREVDRGVRLLDVGLSLEGMARFEIAVLALSFDSSKMVYTGWSISPEYDREILVAETVRDGEQVVFIGVPGSENSYSPSAINLGGIAFRLRDGVGTVTESDFRLSIGEALAAARTITSSGLGVSLNNIRPPRNMLYQNYPNPFNPQTTIAFECASSGHVELKIYSVTGALVKTLVSGQRSRGSHTVSWNGRNNDGTPVASGAYFYEIAMAGATLSKRMVLLR